MGLRPPTCAAEYSLLQGRAEATLPSQPARPPRRRNLETAATGPTSTALWMTFHSPRALTYSPRFAFAPTKGAPERGEGRNTAGCTISAARASSSSWAIGVAMGRGIDVLDLVLADQALSSTTSATASPIRACSPTTTA